MLVSIKTDNIPRVLFAGGGTGGHVYPAIAVAHAIRASRPDAAILFAGTSNHIESTAVPDAGYDLKTITVSGIQRKITLRNLAVPFMLLRGVLQSRRLISAFSPSVAVGTGGYVSGPVLWAAERMGYPTVIQEQNAFPGKTNLVLARKASQIHIAFPEAAKRFPRSQCLLSGNPVRPELASADVSEARSAFGVPTDYNVLLVFGGSLGSAAINEAIASSIDALLDEPNLVVIWQTGSRYYETYRDMVSENSRIRLMKYIDRMDLAYAAADIALCRAGAITCSELAATQTPAILVPSPNVAEDHQTWNARSLSDDGAAILLEEPKMATELVPAVLGLIADSRKRNSMKASLKQRARPDAAQSIAASILKLAQTGGVDE